MSQNDAAVMTLTADEGRPRPRLLARRRLAAMSARRKVCWARNVSLAPGRPAR